jgi:tetratricopeptide (TPR) repeat protein
VTLPPASPFALKPADGSILPLRRVLERDPSNRELRRGLARALAEQGRFGEARQQAEVLLEEDPGDTDARYLLAWGALGTGEGSIPELLRAMPREAAYCEELARISSDLGHMETACQLLARAMALEPASFLLAQKYAIALDFAGHFQETLGFLAELEVRFAGEPASLAKVRFHQASSHLLLGNLEVGFRLMESRLEVPSPQRTLPLQRWEGEALAGRKLLLRAEQGFGDLFMFVRYAAKLADLGAEVYMDPFFSTEGVLATCPGLRGVLSGEVSVPANMLQVELLSLPHRCGTTLASIPAAIPYLSVPAVVPNRGALDAALQGPGRKIGLVWSGNPAHLRQHERNLPGEMLDLLAEVPGVTWFSLQKGEVSRPGLPMVDLAPLLGDFSDTAYALTRLDGLISVDTGIVHLAGALGVPTWVLLSHLPDWRWLLDRTDSPWYPTLTLWRQEAHWDWNGVLERVVLALASSGLSRTSGPVVPGSGGCLPPAP